MSEKKILKHRITKVHQWVQDEGFWLYKNLEALPGIKSHPTSANFQLIESNNSLIELRKELALQNILLRDCRSFKDLGENWLRISLQTKSNNRKILQNMKHIISNML